MLLDFLLTYLAVLAATLAVYALTGLALEAVNRRHPGRRIQAGRDGARRRAEEIGHSVRALSLSALLLASGCFAQARGWTPVPFATGWLSFGLGFVAVFVLYDAWFYFTHRLLHLKPFYRFHALHHRSVAPTAWSNDSSTLVDTLVAHGFYGLVWLVLPVPAAAIFALRLFDQISGMIGHSGFEHSAAPTMRWPSPFITTTFHDLHHSQFRWNYGNFLSLWDRLLGTAHPGYDAMIARIERGEAPAQAAREVR
jgi:Delta7-sterol 5-desaturase